MNNPRSRYELRQSTHQHTDPMHGCEDDNFYRIHDSDRGILEGFDPYETDDSVMDGDISNIHRNPRKSKKGRGRGYGISSASFKRQGVDNAKPFHLGPTQDYGTLHSDSISPANTNPRNNNVQSHIKLSRVKPREFDSAYNTLSSCSTSSHSRSSSSVSPPEAESRDTSPRARTSLGSRSSPGSNNISVSSDKTRRARLKGTSESPPTEDILTESVRKLGQVSSRDQQPISGAGATGGGRIVGIVGVSLSSCSSTSSLRCDEFPGLYIQDTNNGHHCQDYNHINSQSCDWNVTNGSETTPKSRDGNVTNEEQLPGVHVTAVKNLQRRDPLPILRSETKGLSQNLHQLKENRKHAHGLMDSPQSIETSLTSPSVITQAPKPAIPGHIDIFKSNTENNGHKPLSSQVSNISTRSGVMMNVGEMTIKRLMRQVSHISRNRAEYMVEQPEVEEGSAHMRTYFDLALFTCCCCVSPLGFIAVILAAMSDLDYKAGHEQTARRRSRWVLGLSVLGIILTLAIALTVLLLKMNPFKDADVYHRT